jgi:FkbM family methyltransferase
MSTPSTRPQVLRRDFLFGSLAGVSAGVGSWYVAPGRAHEALLPTGTVVSYAQNGEDLIIQSLFRVLKIDKPSYLDIGAYEPIIGSNTYLFWKNGGRGIVVEPNPDLTNMLKRERPGDAVLPIGIGVDETLEADFFMCSWPQLNTFDKETADQFETVSNGQAKLLKVIKVPLVNVNKILGEHLKGAPLNLLSIDAEGFDIYILKSLDFVKCRPNVIVTEHSLVPEKRKVLLDLMEASGYTLRGLTYSNSIFADTKLMPRI